MNPWYGSQFPTAQESIEKLGSSEHKETLFIEDVIVKLWREITRPAVETQMLAG
jgi:hypothetical protein